VRTTRTQARRAAAGAARFMLCAAKTPWALLTDTATSPCHRPSASRRVPSPGSRLASRRCHTHASQRAKHEDCLRSGGSSGET